MQTKVLLLSGWFAHFSFGSSMASDMEFYVEKLRDHPEVQQFFVQKDLFDELSVAELALPDPQFYIGTDNMFFDDPEYKRLLSPTRSIGFVQNVPSIFLRKAESSEKKILSKHRELSGHYMLKRLKARFVSQVAKYEKIKTLEDLAKQQLIYYDLMESELKGQLASGMPVYALFFEVDVDRMEVEQRLNKLEYEMFSTEEELKWLVGEVPQIESLKNSDLYWDQTETSLLRASQHHREDTLPDTEAETNSALIHTVARLVLSRLLARWTLFAKHEPETVRKGMWRSLSEEIAQPNSPALIVTPATPQQHSLSGQIWIRKPSKHTEARLRCSQLK